MSGPVLADSERRERVRRHRADALDEILQYQLDELRRARHITQEELAAALGVRQPSVSRLEHGDDAKLSTLRAYVEALGGRLELAAVFDDDERFPLAV
ncbi:MAG: helix-turn-helix transcriptional regulator [Acidimicrobiales bacterium]|nr:helix-turn-helix transcriptional regulator [Acidimicrobiales bacterium]